MVPFSKREIQKKEFRVFWKVFFFVRVFVFFCLLLLSKEKKRGKNKNTHVVVRYLLYVSCNYNTLALMYYARLIIV